MAYVPPSRRGANFKSRLADGDAPPLPSEQPAPSQVLKKAGRYSREIGAAQQTVRTTKDPQSAPPPRACAFFARDGTCAKGDQCRFSHADADVAAFKVAGGAEAFAQRRAARDEEEKAAQAAAKLAKQEAKRLRKAQALASADLPDDSWSYVPTRETNKVVATEPASLLPPTTDAPTLQPSSSSSPPAPGDGWMSWADAEEEAERAERKAADAKEQSARGVFALVLSSSEEEEEQSDDEQPAPKQQKPAAAAKPPSAKKQLSKKEQKALKKAQEMAELQAALVDVAEATGEPELLQSSGGTVAPEESAASQKKRLKKQRQKAAAAAAKAAQVSASSSSAPCDSAVGLGPDAASKLNEEEQAALAQKKLQKLRDEKAKKLAAKKRADKQKKKTKGADYLHKKAAEKHADHVAKKKGKKVLTATVSPPTSPLGTPVKQENPAVFA
jgi:hypothetical protein